MTGMAGAVHEGQILAGKYRVDRVLGAGAMGVVVAAHHQALDTQVAIKFLMPGMLENAEAVDRFAREARAAAKISNEHVTRVLDVGTLESGAPYIVMEYLEGCDLQSWLRESGPLPIDQAVDFLLQAGEAVAEAHTLGIVHRDLKPSNMFCVRRSNGALFIKVLDFGISKITIGASGMTRSSIMMGTPLYMSPEQMESARNVDARTDVWALGVVLFQLLTGALPFGGDTLPEICLKVTTRPPPPVRSLRPIVPVELEAAISRCLEKNRDKRWQSVGEFCAAIAPFGPAYSSAQRRWQTVSASSRPQTIPASGNGLDSLASSPRVSFGTMGGVGNTSSGAAWGKRKRFAIGAAGSILGLTVAAFVLVSGLTRSTASPTPVGTGGAATTAAAGPGAGSAAPSATARNVQAPSDSVPGAGATEAVLGHGSPDDGLGGAAADPVPRAADGISRGSAGRLRAGAADPGTDTPVPVHNVPPATGRRPHAPAAAGPGVASIARARPMPEPPAAPAAPPAAAPAPAAPPTTEPPKGSAAYDDRL